MSFVLVIAAHPDDEVLGCGATMARHADAGDTVDVVIVAEGETSRHDASSAGAESGVAALREAAIAAAKVLGTREPIFLGLPDNRLDSIDMLDLIKMIDRATSALRPDVIYTHSPSDLNIDHRLVANAVNTVFRPLPDATFSAVYQFEVLSSSEWADPAMGPGFRPDYFVNATEYLDRKIEALTAYESEMRPFPHSRSYEAVSVLAKVRGCAAGLEAAEAFETVRRIAR